MPWIPNLTRPSCYAASLPHPPFSHAVLNQNLACNALGLAVSSELHELHETMHHARQLTVSRLQMIAHKSAMLSHQALNGGGGVVSVQNSILPRPRVLKVLADGDEGNAGALPSTKPRRNPWRWWGYCPSLSYWASIIQFCGATMFTVSVISGIPGVIGPDQWQLQQALIWSMQVVGSVCFLVRCVAPPLYSRLGLFLFLVC